MDHRRRFSAFVAKGEEPRDAILGALEFTTQFLPETSIKERARIKAAVIVEEIVSNSLRHGGKDRDLNIGLTLDDIGDALVIEMEDDGAEFDSSDSQEFDGPDPHTGGGIGLAIVRAWGEDITYTRTRERNLLRLTIR